MLLADVHKQRPGLKSRSAGPVDEQPPNHWKPLNGQLVNCCEVRIIVREGGVRCGTPYTQSMAPTYASAAAMVSAFVAFGRELSTAPGGGLASAFMLQSHCWASHYGDTSIMRHTPNSGHFSAHPNLRHPEDRNSVVLNRLQYEAHGWTPAQQQCNTAALMLLSPRRLLLPRAVGTARSSATAARASMSASSSPEDLVRPGSVVVYEADVKGRAPTLGLVMDKVGKKKALFAVKPAASGSVNVNVALRQVRYVVPGGSVYEAADLTAFEEQAPVDESLLEEAWQMLLEESMAAAVAMATAAAEGGGKGEEDSKAGTSDPRGMAQLLYGAVEPTPQECYQAFRLLEGREGTLYFKRLRDGSYESRSRCVGACVRIVFAAPCLLAVPCLL